METSVVEEDKFLKEFVEEYKDKCKCGKESDYGCHGIKDGEVYSEFYCKECYQEK